MPVQDKLAHSVGRKDQIPNKNLAVEISEFGNSDQVTELIKFIESGPKRRLQMDAILTLAYVSELNPKLAVPEVDFFLQKLDDPISRVAWGSMIALSHLVKLAPEKLYNKLPVILDAMQMDSIVGRDHGYKILVHLYSIDRYREDLFHILLEQLVIVRPNQLGQYTERLMTVLAPEHKADLIVTLEERRMELTNQYHLKRLAKNLKKLYK